MELSFFASPSDLKALFAEIEVKTPLHYFWGFNGPVADVLGPFHSCNEIDCFGYAIDDIYRLDFNITKVPFQIVRNARGYYNQSCALSLMLCGRTGTGGILDKTLTSAIIHCPINAPQNDECRKLFFRIKRRMNQCWHKINGMFFGSEVYNKRKNLIFWNREGYVDDPFYFDDEDEIRAISPDRLYDPLEPRFVEAPYTLPISEQMIRFYSSEQDMVQLFQNIEKQFSMKYKYHKEALEYSEKSFTTFSGLRREPQKHSFIFAYEPQYYNSIEIHLGDFQGSVAVPGSISFAASCPKYGGTLLRFIQETVEKAFKPIYIKHYGTYYLSPEIWEAKERLIFDNGDPRFRWKDGEFVNVWRAEWEAMK